MLNVAILVACFNRCDTTESWLKSLSSEVPRNWNISIFAVDDASTDCTASILSHSEMNIKVRTGTGNWYWAKSMSVAEDMALSEGDFDYLLWANDDTKYFPNSLNYVENVRANNSSCIIVGKFVDPNTGLTVYGGLIKMGKNPFKYRLAEDDGQERSCDNFHGNFVLIPVKVANLIGRIDGLYQHAYADYDYGERARRLEIDILSTGLPIGTCLDNKKDFGQFKKLHERLKYVFGPKGLPLKSQVRYLRKYGPRIWFRFLIQPYVRALFGINSKKSK
jgi:GT2 family glycosyltransferase